MSNSKHRVQPAATVSKRDELLELSRALVLTSISAGMVPGSPQSAREFVRMAREVISEVEKPTQAPQGKRQIVSVPIGAGGGGDEGDDTAGADLGGLEELEV